MTDTFFDSPDDTVTQPGAPCDLLTGCRLGLGHKGRCEPTPADPPVPDVTDDTEETVEPIRTEQEARVTRNARDLLTGHLEAHLVGDHTGTDPKIVEAHEAALRAQIAELDDELDAWANQLAADTPSTPTTPATDTDETDPASGDVVDGEPDNQVDDRAIPGVPRPTTLPDSLTDALTIWGADCSAQVRQTVYPLLDTDDEPVHNDDGTPAHIAGPGCLLLAFSADVGRPEEPGDPYRLNAGDARQLRDLLNIATARGLL